MKETDYDFSECVVTCDECDRTVTVDGIDYSDINNEIKKDGWIVKYIGYDWHEFCCKECCNKFMNRLK